MMAQLIFRDEMKKITAATNEQLSFLLASRTILETHDNQDLNFLRSARQAVSEEEKIHISRWIYFLCYYSIILKSRDAPRARILISKFPQILCFFTIIHWDTSHFFYSHGRHGRDRYPGIETKTYQCPGPEAQG